MTKTNMQAKALCTVGLYLHGERLEPEKVSEILGFDATSSWRKDDEHITTSGTKLIRKSGLWSVYFSSSEYSVSKMLDDLLNLVPNRNNLLKAIEGLDRAHIAVFIAKDAGVVEDESMSFELDATTLDRLSRLGATVSFEISIGPP